MASAYVRKKRLSPSFGLRHRNALNQEFREGKHLLLYLKMIEVVVRNTWITPEQGNKITQKTFYQQSPLKYQSLFIAKSAADYFKLCESLNPFDESSETNEILDKLRRELSTQHLLKDIAKIKYC